MIHQPLIYSTYTCTQCLRQQRNQHRHCNILLNKCTVYWVTAVPLRMPNSLSFRFTELEELCKSLNFCFKRTTLNFMWPSFTLKVTEYDLNTRQPNIDIPRLVRSRFMCNDSNGKQFSTVQLIVTAIFPHYFAIYALHEFRIYILCAPNIPLHVCHWFILYVFYLCKCSCSCSCLEPSKLLFTYWQQILHFVSSQLTNELSDWLTD